ncbi:hypothetical protein DO021_05965 [Desulfobacter hydrogenophilus]|uniref:Uncharacterized protein n=1 Tax=Desulfobacter hydrogenophilus TaxID=2291 RepID=A0A328FIG2_9BACT|nr:hypothetical protein [Desulfobacter hydrogenophilus]NDY71092.1 hypothetical protein [Desulfobacter hydrogenophilus]QBH11730.1 hypothetical protein EYB58_01595 [Desulfobacter hydrogenophilus]RAM02943.1 hypothetical protein DO021_05965 [Desulfobacter hydrogenophilus]
MKKPLSTISNSYGYLMMDLMVAILLMAIAIAPMMNSFFPSFNAMFGKYFWCVYALRIFKNTFLEASRPCFSFHS